MSHIVGLDSKALNQGSQRPPLEPDKLRAYSMRFCPFAQRTLLFLAAKEIPVEIVNVNLKDKPDWFLQMNPLGKVPVLEFNGSVIYESAVCNEWLDQVYPDKKILPTDPTAAAHQKMLVERLSVLQSYFTYAFSGFNPKKLENVLSAIDLAENLLQQPFYGGSQLGWADLMCWSFIERLEPASQLSGSKMPVVSEKKWPKLTDYINRMKQQPCVKATMRSSDLHAKYLETWFRGEPADPDMAI